MYCVGGSRYIPRSRVEYLLARFSVGCTLLFMVPGTLWPVSGARTRPLNGLRPRSSRASRELLSQIVTQCLIKPYARTRYVK